MQSQLTKDGDIMCLCFTRLETEREEHVEFANSHWFEVSSIYFPEGLP